MEQHSLPISVIICTYNPKADLFLKVLEHLEKQTLAKEDWELIIIDNHSEKSVARMFSVSWHPWVRFLEETRQGQIFARFTGIEAAKGDWIVFVDDDNLLDRHYLENALSIVQKHPFLGVFGGSCDGQFEKNPAPHQLPVLDILAIRNVQRDQWANFAYWPCMPLGAGMVLKREAAFHHIEKLNEDSRLFRLSRSGSQLMSGDDVDIVLTCLENGWACGVFCSLRLVHVIPENRLSDEYLLRLITGITASSVWQTYVRGGNAVVKYHYALRPLFTAIKEVLKLRQHGWRSVVFETRRLWAIRKGYTNAKKLIQNDCHA